MNTWEFHLLNWLGVHLMWVISFSFVYIGLLVWTFLQSHKLNLTYCLKSSLLLAFCFLFVCMVDQTQIYPSSISPLGLFQVILYVIFIVWTHPSPPPLPSTHTAPLPLFIGNWDFWKIKEGGIKIFLWKWRVAHIGGLSIEKEVSIAFH